MKQISISVEQRARLLAYEQDEKAPDMRIPIPADGWAYPSDFCYQHEDGYLIDEGAYEFAIRRKFEWEG